MKKKYFFFAVVWVAMAGFVCPVEACDPPTNLTVNNISPLVATISWTPGDTNVTRYQYNYYVLPDTVNPSGGGMLYGNSTQVTLGSLTPNTTYLVRLYALCDNDDNTTWSTPAEATLSTLNMVCDPPGNIRISYRGSNTIALDWSGSEYGVTHYVRWRTLSQTYFNTATASNNNRYVINNLTPNTTYLIRLQTYCQYPYTSTSFDTLITTDTCGLIQTTPYCEDFERITVYNEFTLVPSCWETYGAARVATCTDNVNASYPNSSSLYIDSDTSTVVVHLPPIDTFVVDPAQLSLRFSACLSTNGSGRGLILFQRDTIDDTIIVQNSTWRDYAVSSVSLDTTSRITLRIPRGCPALFLDNFVIGQSSNCPFPQNVSVERITSTGVHLTWNASGGQGDTALRGYRVELSNLDDTTQSSRTYGTQDTGLFVHALAPNTHYRATIRALCTNDTNAVTRDFTTLDYPCGGYGNETDTLLIANSATACRVNSSPYNAFTSLIPREEIGSPCELTGMGIYLLDTLPQTRQLSIMLVNDEIGNLNGGSSPQRVFNGNTTLMPGWNDITFVTPFIYTGTHLHVIVSIDQSPIPLAGHRVSPLYSTSGTRLDMRFTRHSCQQYQPCRQPQVYATQVTSMQVDLEWLPGAQDTVWDVYLRYPFDNHPDSLIAAMVDSTHYTYHCQRSGFPHLFTVVPHCSGVPDSSLASSITVRVPCGGVETLPFFEDFEQFVDFNNNGCWRQYGYLYLRSNDTNRYIHISSSHNPLLVLPFINHLTQLLSIDFDLYPLIGNPQQLAVGVMTDPDDVTTFVGVDTILIIPQELGYRWIPITMHLENYRGAPGHIALYFLDVLANIDNIHVDYTPDCRRPDILTVRSVTPTTATIGWRRLATSHYTVVEYGRRGFTPGTGIKDTATNDSITLTGLRPNSYYEFLVYHMCGADTSVPSLRSHIITECSDIDSLPYIEDFEQWPTGNAVTAPLPPCMQYGNTTSYVTRGLDYTGRSRNRYAIQSQYLVLPPLDSTHYRLDQTILTLGLSRVTGASMVVGVCRDPHSPAATFTAVDTLPLSYSIQIHHIYFDRIPGNSGQYIALKQTTSGGTYFLDSLRIDSLPTCAPPDRVVASNITSTSVDIDWTSHAFSVGAEVEFVPAGAQPGMGMGIRHSVAGHPCTLTGMLPGIVNLCYVREICGPGDTSAWSYLPASFTPQQTAFQVPFCENFEDTVAGLGQWQSTSMTTNVQWSWGHNATDYLIGNHSVYVTGDAPLRVALYRDIDFGNNDSTYTLSFRTRVCSNNSQSYNGLRVYLLPLSDAVTQDLLNNIAHPEVLTLATEVQTGISWLNYTFDLDTLHGLRRLLFVWHNNGSGQPISMALDNICINPSVCPRPFNIQCTERRAESVELSWFGDADSLYQAVYFNRAGGPSVTCSTHTNHIRLERLNPGDEYDIQVRMRCGNRWTNYSPHFVFNTPICDGSETVTIPNEQDTTFGVLTTNRLPFDGTANNSYTQQLYLAEEIGQAGYINYIMLNFSENSTPSAFFYCYFYLGHTDKTRFLDSNDFVDPRDLQMVYMGTVSATPGWFRIKLDTPFPYNGTDNLVLAVVNIGGYATPHAFFTAHATSEVTSIQTELPTSSFRDLNEIDSIPTHRSLYRIRNHVSFELCPDPECAIPHVKHTNPRLNRATIRWHSCGEGAFYTLQYKQLRTEDWATLDSITDTFASISNTIPERDYLYRVRNNCTEEESQWAIGQYFTPSSIEGCLDPEGLRPYNLTHNSATLSWFGDENNVLYEINVYNAAYNRTNYSYINRCRFDSMEVGPVYNAVVRAYCSNIEEPSPWSEPIQFTLPPCPDVDSVRLVSTDGTSAVIDWDGTPDAEGWIVLYGEPRTPERYCDRVIAREHPFTLQGLVEGQEYMIHVRTICEGGVTAEHWSEPLIFTNSVGISDDREIRPVFLLRPNPTRGTTEVVLATLEGEPFLEILDMLGRVVYCCRLTALTTQLDLGDSDAGVYIVRVRTEIGSYVQRVIKR